jgi:hypothetical protein
MERQLNNAYPLRIPSSIQYTVRTLLAHSKDKLRMISLAFRYRSSPSFQPIISSRACPSSSPPTFTFLSCAKRNISYRLLSLSLLPCIAIATWSVYFNSRISPLGTFVTGTLSHSYSRHPRCCCQCHTSSLPLRQLQMLLRRQISMFCTRSGMRRLQIG